MTCCSDIGFAITLMAKFSANPAEIHYKHLKMICTYLRQNKHWGICYKMNLATGPPSIDLPKGDFSNSPMPLPDELPDFPTLPNGPTITYFCDAAFGNIKPKCKSTTGYAIFLAGATIVYQGVPVLSGTKMRLDDTKILSFNGRLKQHTHKRKSI